METPIDALHWGREMAITLKIILLLRARERAGNWLLVLRSLCP
jgi:hypothetical protein